jgi:prepilin-type N-terminal cleavage/methylation domain-containing protein/prepilin-type processing-associated H-X9-DG protein
MVDINCKSKGFTLIELLVVVAIISVLVALLLPSLARSREMAKQVACSSNMKQMVVGCLYYANENSDRLPPACWGWTNDDRQKTWMKYIASYVGVSIYVGPDIGRHNRKTIFYCSSDDSPWQAEGYGGLVRWDCGKCSYSANLAVMDQITQDVDQDGVTGPRSVSSVPEPSMTIMLMEGAHFEWNMIGYASGSYFNCENKPWREPYNCLASNILGYHNGVSNWAFVDGHIASMSYIKTISPKNLWLVSQN